MASQPDAASSSSSAPPPAPSVLDSMFNWIVDDKSAAGQGQPVEGGQPAPESDLWKSFTTSLEHVKAEVTTSIESLSAQKAPEQAQEGAASPAPENGEAPPPAQSAFDLEQISKQASTVSTDLTNSISLWYYGKEGEGEAPPQPGFKNTVDSLYTSFVGPSQPEGEKKEEEQPPQDQKPFLADYFLPKSAEGDEASAPPPEKVDVDKIVFDFFSGTASQLQRLIDQGPPIPDRAKAPEVSKEDGKEPAPAGAPAAAGRAAPPPRPSSDSKSLIGASAVRVTPSPAAASPSAAPARPLPSAASPSAAPAPSVLNRYPPPRPAAGTKP